MNVTVVVSIIEAIIFLVPFISIFIKLGKTLQRVEHLEEQIKDMKDVNEKLASIDAKIEIIMKKLEL